jgi:deferrochelatase/peroxidase EfeB
MPVNLNAPLSWETAAGDDLAMLTELQPNIVKAHTREFLTILFLSFADAASGRGFLRALVNAKPALLKSARVHLDEVKAFKASVAANPAKPKPGTPYVGVGLTAAGYDILGVTKRPSDSAFQAGMKAAALGDPDPKTWDKHLRATIHAVVLVGDAHKAPRDKALARVRSLISGSGGVTVLGEDKGHGLHNKLGEGIEHFGYVDGRSQPIFLVEDVQDEKHLKDGTTVWDPAFPLARVIVPDPAAPDPTRQFGSYFVYRKLEQNVRLFKGEEKALATRLRLKGQDDERAGAMLIGRFEDGTPLAIQSADGFHSPVPNDFDYDSDDEGGKCPFFGHIRKMNPRGSGGFEPVDKERLHIMARRGQTYGVRTDDPNDGKLANKPTGGVGLLFMAFNASIGEQFEFVQTNWANNPSFPNTAGGPQPGLDPVIGQGPRPALTCPLSWGAGPGGQQQTASPPQAVTMKGGEYFFMPSLAFLRTL